MPLQCRERYKPKLTNSTMTETIVLSIRPRFVEEIFEGRKRFEFRKVMPSNREIHRVLIYESAPISMVVGEFTVAGLGRCSVESMWHFCAPFAGITKREFFEYFQDCHIAQCYIINTYRKYKKPYPITLLGFNRPPQNFYYIGNLTAYETE